MRSELRTFRVATFVIDLPGTRKKKFGISHVSAYVRDFNPSWDGCVMIEVEAVDGTQAKKIARRKRVEIEEAKDA